ncbi:MAG: DUF58 domain-containing protein [Puniceicoccaceae bacterium]
MKKRKPIELRGKSGIAINRRPKTVEERLLDSRAVGKATLLGMMARKIVEGSMAGENKSPFSGFAIEFRQHREYAPGDELKHIDWRLFGRTDRFYIKQYEQETNFDATLLLDASESMAYGEGARNKMEYGRVLAAVFAHLILMDRNRLAVRLFDTDARELQPPSSNPGALHNLLESLVRREPGRETAIGGILDDLAAKLRARGICILISDLFDDPDKVLEGLRHLAFLGQEIIVFHVMHPDELEFPFDGTVEFEGYEVPEKLLLQPRRVRESYLENVAAFRNRIRRTCEQNDIRYTLVNTGKPPEEIVSGFLSSRAHSAAR